MVVVVMVGEVLDWLPPPNAVPRREVGGCGGDGPLEVPFTLCTVVWVVSGSWMVVAVATGLATSAAGLVAWLRSAGSSMERR